MEHRKTPTGALWALLASLIFSVNDTLIKFLSDGYALHQIVFTRSLTGVLLLMIVIIPLSGGYGALRTQRLGTASDPSTVRGSSQFVFLHGAGRFALGNRRGDFLYCSVFDSRFSQ
jgi:drug/metabolite transporter (DMT)-like permease